MNLAFGVIFKKSLVQKTTQPKKQTCEWGKLTHCVPSIAQTCKPLTPSFNSLLHVGEMKVTVGMAMRVKDHFKSPWKQSQQ